MLDLQRSSTKSQRLIHACITFLTLIISVQYGETFHGFRSFIESSLCSVYVSVRVHYLYQEVLRTAWYEK